MDEIFTFLQNNQATIVSICAIFLTIQQGWATRAHNRLSVRPRLTTFTHRMRAGEDVEGTVYEFTLFNNGLGPAFIERFEYLIDGQAVQVTQPSDIYEAIQKSTPLLIDRNSWWFSILRPEHVMAKDSSQVLGRILVAESPPAAMLNADRYHVRVEFKSAYGESFIYDSRNHTSVKTLWLNRLWGCLRSLGR